MTTQTSQYEAPAVNPEAVEAFAGTVGHNLAQAYNGVLVYLGDRLGLWRALGAGEALTSAEVAARCGLAERYVREWLSAQSAAGYLTLDVAQGRFSLPAAHALVLADEDSPAFGAAGFEIVTAVYASADKLAHAFATGVGVGWHEHDPRLFGGVDRFFRTLYRASLVQEWLPSVPGLLDRLSAGCRVLDVGCGLGSATLLLAEEFPASTFVGVDYHEESVRRARHSAAAAGLEGRVHFEVADAGSYDGEYDVVFFFDAVHDMGDPVGALRHTRSRLAPDGMAVAIEPFAADSLEETVQSPVSLIYYAASTCLCVPNSMAQGGPALGAQAGPQRLTGAFAEAGFSTARVAASTPYNLVIEARP